MTNSFEVIIIGSGPGGIAAAKTLAQAGKKIALVEEKQVGGVCLNEGCIPTKFLLSAVAPLPLLAAQKRYGVLSSQCQLDFTALRQRKNLFLEGSRQVLISSLQASGITIYQGRGVILEPGLVRVREENPLLLQAPDLILATGSHSASYPGLTADGLAVLDSAQILELTQIPASLLVVGSGAIGLEFAAFFSAAGSKVTLLEAMPQLIPTEDEDIAQELAKHLKRAGVRVISGQRAVSLLTLDGQAHLTLTDGQILQAEKALLAMGRRPNLQGLNLETLGASLNPQGFVQVDAHLRAAPRTYALGDINGRTLLAHAAEHQGEWAARHILGENSLSYASGPIPHCIFGHPEVMRAGVSAKEAAASGLEVRISRADFSSNPIAQSQGLSTGFAKAVWQEDTLVGLAALGPGATHLVSAAQLLVLRKTTRRNLSEFMFAHPTLDEILKSALLAPQTRYKGGV